MGCEGCCIYPHGKISIYATVLAISNYLFAMSSSYGCYYVKVDYTFSELRAGRTFDKKSGIGIFAYEDALRDDNSGKNNFVCYTYTDDMKNSFDGGFRAARAFAVLANICIGVAMIAVIASACASLTINARRFLAALYFQGALYEILTYSFFASNICNDGGCTFYIGAGLVLVSSFIAVINGILVLKFPEDVRIASNNDDPFKAGPNAKPFAPGTQTVTETIMPNGKKKITKTTVNIDGSQVVEESMA